ncbi:mediator of RNA polymerase II transcription subunit 15-like isoform X3 [Crassostrea virginica]
MAEQAMDWQGQPFRAKVVAQIEDAVRSSTSPMNKSSIEMENHVFQKAKTREEYLALVARLILHVKEINSNRDKSKGPGGMGIPQGMPPGTAGMSQTMQDPIGALQNLTVQGIGPVGQQGMMNQQQQAHLQQQQRMLLQQRQMQQMQQQQQQRPQLERQDAFLVTSAQHVQTMAQPLPANSQVGMTYQQTMQGGGIQQPGMQQAGMQPGMQQGMQPGMQQGMQQGLQQVGMQQSGMQQGMQQAGMQQPGMPMVTMGMQQQRPQATSVGGISQASPMAFGQQMQPGAIGSSQQAVPSPKPPSISSMMMSPSPQGLQGMAGNPRGNSPRVLNTPGGPNSPSPNTPRPHEEQAYLDKLKQLQKYIEPLKRMINRLTTGKDEESKKDISKMENLLKILTDPTKRLPMATLLKCEQVLDSLEMSKAPGVGSVPSATPIITATPMHMCQPLLDAVATNMKSPMFNHALQQTFGPAMTALFGAPIRAPSPPPKKRKREEDEEEEEEIPHILQGEIARLGSRFRVSLDPTQHSSSKDVHLVCKIDDKNLPCVPPISVKVPELYPQVSPQCDTKAQDYESSPFLTSIQESLSRLMLQMPSKYTFTQLMDKWEMSIRRACAAPS